MIGEFMAHCLVYIVGHGKYGFLGFGRSRHSHPTTIDNNCLIYLIWCFRPNMIVNWDHYLRYAFNKRLNTMKHQPAANFISTFLYVFYDWNSLILDAEILLKSPSDPAWSGAKRPPSTSAHGVFDAFSMGIY